MVRLNGGVHDAGVRLHFAMSPNGLLPLEADMVHQV